MAELRDLDLGRGRRLPARLLTLRFARAGGPGGQHVNKVETKAEVRLDLDAAEAVLGAAAVARVRERLRTRLDREGRLLVASAATRERHRNVERALGRLEELLREALVRQRPRRPTKPSRAARRRRVADKRARSERKSRRGRVRPEE